MSRDNSIIGQNSYFLAVPSNERNLNSANANASRQTSNPISSAPNCRTNLPSSHSNASHQSSNASNDDSSIVMPHPNNNGISETARNDSIHYSATTVSSAASAGNTLPRCGLSCDSTAERAVNAAPVNSRLWNQLSREFRCEISPNGQTANCNRNRHSD